MISGRRRVGIIAAIAIGIVLVVGIYRAGLDEIPTPPADNNITAPHGGVAVGERISTRSWSIRYDRMVSNQDQTVVDLFGVHDGVIFKGSKPYLKVRATHLIVNTVTRDFTATGPLHVETISHAPEREFDTDSAVWSDAEQKMTFAHKTTIVTGAAEPMHVDSLTLNVKSGDVDATGASGAFRTK
jgi:hypothetical protein